MACGGVFFTYYSTYRVLGQGARSLGWGISEALGVTLGGRPSLRTSTSSGTVNLATYVHLSFVFGFNLHEHARQLPWYSVMRTYTIYMYT